MYNYTEKMHAIRMLLILENPDPCNKCPGFKKLYINYEDQEYYSTTKIFNMGMEESGVCQMCHSFIGMEFDFKDKSCPCFILGKDDAIKQTWLALEKKGYI